MVKNESRILERAFASSFPYVDGICLLDTGSTDNTVEIAERLISKKREESPKFVGKVYHCPFKNFGYNRTKSFEFALELLKETDWDLQTTYGLLLDADMVLRVKDTQKMRRVIEKYDSLMLYQADNYYKYYNVRIIKMCHKWTCSCVTHEYWHVHKDDDSQKTMAVLETDVVWIDDISDGGCKSDKLERDIRLLEEAIKTEKEHESRYEFYLGQSYMGLGKTDKAITHYKRHISLGSFKESVWFATCMISRLYMMEKNIEKAVEYCDMAYTILPTRSEPLFDMASHFYSLGGKENLEKAEKYVDKGIDIPHPKENLIYINEMVYSFGMKLLKLYLMIDKGEPYSNLVNMFNKMKSTATIHSKPAYVDDIICKMTSVLDPIISVWTPFNSVEYILCVVNGTIYAFHASSHTLYTWKEGALLDPVNLPEDILSVFSLNQELCYASEKGAYDKLYNPVDIPAKTATINTEDNLFLQVFTRRFPGVFDKEGNMYVVLENRFPSMTAYLLARVDATTGKVLEFTRPFTIENEPKSVSVVNVGDNGIVWLCASSNILVVDFTKML